MSVPSPDRPLLNLFGNILTNVTNGLVSVTQTALNGPFSAVANILNPTAAVKTIITPFVNSMNNLLNFGIVGTSDGSLLNQVLSGAANIINAIVKTGNDILARGSALLSQIFTNVTNRLGKAITRVVNTISWGANVVLGLLGRLHDRFVSGLARFVPILDSCGLKMSSLVMTSASNGIKTFTTQTTSIVAALEQTLKTQYNTFATDVNATTTNATVYSAQISSDLLDDIVKIHDSTPTKSDAFTTCLSDMSELAVYAQAMINDNVVTCANEAFSSANQTDAIVDQGINALGATATTATATICKCVENVVAGNLLQRAAANTCANNELKKLTTDSVQASADEIAKKHLDSLDAAHKTYTQCITEINDQIPGLVDYVKGEIVACGTL